MCIEEGAERISTALKEFVEETGKLEQIRQDDESWQYLGTHVWEIYRV